MRTVVWMRRLGWSLFIIGVAWAVYLESKGFRPDTPPDSAMIHAQQAQVFIWLLAFLQILIGGTGFGDSPPQRNRMMPSYLTTLGAILFTAGSVAGFWWRGAVFIAVGGALVSSCGFGLLAFRSPSPRTRSLFGMVTFGLILYAMTVISHTASSWTPGVFLGREDGIRLRLLRLAEVAALALPILTLLLHDLAARRVSPSEWVKRGQAALFWGALGLPLALTVAGLGDLRLKYLMVAPAICVFLGAVAGALLATRLARPAERWGWLLIALSMGVGLTMGMYAFNGPLPPPPAIGEYNTFTRHLLRLVHAYAIVFGVLMIFVSRELDHLKAIAVVSVIPRLMNSSKL